MKTINAEFENEKLAQIYEDFNSFSEDEDFWLKVIGDLKVSNIVDFGCGSGLFTQVLSDSGYDMKGIEPAKAMLNLALRKDMANKIDYIHGGYEKLQGFKTDLILMTSHVFQFITDNNEYESLLKNSHEVLNTGGYILFDSKNPLLKPWKNYTREKCNNTKETRFGKVNTQVDVSEIKGNIITHNIYYNFLKSHEEIVSSNTLIYKTKEEIEQNLIENGFKIIKVYGDWKGEEYSEKSNEMIFLARKK